MSLFSVVFIGLAGQVTGSVETNRSQPQEQANDIVVTALKTPTRLRETPLSISVVTGVELDQTQARDAEALAKLIPGLSATDAGPGNKRYALRGLQSAGEPEVALYYDEVPIAGLPGASLDTGDSQLDLRLVDIERVEVLRGPQGTLYGNGSVGGTIKIVSNRPRLDEVDEWATASVGATKGGETSYGLSGGFNLPLVNDRAALRVNGFASRDGGWIDTRPDDGIKLPQLSGRNINRSEVFGGRAILMVQPAPAWTITAIASGQHLKVREPYEIFPAFSVDDGHNRAKAFVHRPWNEHAWLGNIITEYDGVATSWLLTLSYQDRKLDRTGDTTRFVLSQFGCDEFDWLSTCFGSPLVPAATLSEEFVRSWSGELRVRSKGKGALRWTVGAFGQLTQTGRDLQVARTQDGDIGFNDDGTVANRLFARRNRDKFQQFAAFGEVTWQLASTFDISVGGRWFHSYRSDQQTIFQQFFPSSPTGIQPFQKFSESKLFKALRASYRPVGWQLFYAQAAQGFRAGGPNYPGGFALTAPPYEADSVWNYEIGWKGSFDRNRWNASVALFDIEWRNLQQLLPQQLFSYIVNGGKARSKGFEAFGEYRPVATTALSAAVTFNDARLVGSQPLSNDPLVQTSAGDRLANVPKWTFNAGATQEWKLDDRLTFGLRADVSYQSGRDTLVATQNAANIHLHSWKLVDAHAWLGGIGLWRLSVDVRNIFNKYAEIAGRAEDSNFVSTITPARPRSIWLNVSLTPRN